MSWDMKSNETKRIPPSRGSPPRYQCSGMTAESPMNRFPAPIGSFRNAQPRVPPQQVRGWSLGAESADVKSERSEFTSGRGGPCEESLRGGRAKPSMKTAAVGSGKLLPRADMDSGLSQAGTVPKKEASIPNVETLVVNQNCRIDSSYVPRPVLSNEPATQSEGKVLETDQGTLPPPSYGNYTILDKGNASCRFIRMSMYQIPILKSTLKDVSMPLVASISPFPLLGPHERKVPLVNLSSEAQSSVSHFKEEGPPKCPRCLGYLSPFTVLSGTSAAICHLCTQQYQLPQDYCHVLEGHETFEGQQQFSTASKGFCYDRPELCKGVVDYVAPLSTFYSKESPKSIDPGPEASTSEMKLRNTGYCFVVDTSASSIETGFFQSVMAAIKYSVGLLSESYHEVDVEVCVITFDENIKFYSSRISSSGTAYPEILVVGDVLEPFPPASPQQLFFKARTQKTQVESILEFISHNHIEGLGKERGSVPKNCSCGNGALQAALLLLKAHRAVGSVEIFYTQFPNVGAGAIKKMDMPSFATKQSISGLTPIAELSEFYGTIVRTCAENGLSVDVFAASLANRPIGTGSLGFASRKTGGHLHFYKGFDINKDFHRLCHDLSRVLLIPKSFDCAIKLRCSSGLCVSKAIFGPSVGKSLTKSTGFPPDSVIRVPRLDSDHSILFELNYDTDIPEGSRRSFLQLACLHTTVEGYRRIRVINLAIINTTSMTSVFRYCDVEAMLTYFVRFFGSMIVTNAKATAKEAAIRKLVDILYCYRLHCAANTSPGQLILPDALRSLPLYVSCMFKHLAFRVSSELLSDERNAFLTRLLNAPPHQLIFWIYPRLFVLHRSYSSVKGEKLSPPQVEAPTGLESNVTLPLNIGTTGERVTSDGIFILDNGVYIMLYIGPHVSPEIANMTLDTTLLERDDGLPVTLDSLQGPMGDSIKKIVHQIRKDKGLRHPWQPFRFIRPKSVDASYFTANLLEDRIMSEPCYVDFLCQLHKAVHFKMDD